MFDGDSDAMAILNKLDADDMMSILAYLNENQPVSKSDIYSDVSRNPGMEDKLATLHEMGLIDMIGTPESSTTYVLLTKKGKVVANRIDMIIDIIENGDDGGCTSSDCSE